MTRVAYVAGASHSGSTLLHLVLGAHSRCVGLGEVARTLGPGENGLAKSLRTKVIWGCGATMEVSGSCKAEPWICRIPSGIGSLCLT